MRKLFKEYFEFTRSERNGIVVLLTLSIFFFLIPYAFPYIFKPKPVDFSAFKANIARMEANKNYTKKNHTYKRQIETFPFNPNKASKDDFIRLGLSSKTAQTIINYRSKGGGFLEKEDLKKIYGLKEEDYQRLSPFVFIERSTISTKSKSPQTSISPPAPKPIERFIFDPNTVSKEKLGRLGFSGKVINTVLKFRSKARFRKVSDFAKIYGISEMEFKEIEPYIQIIKEVKTTSYPAAFSDQKIASKKDTTTTKSKVYDAVSINVNEADIEDWQKIRGIGPYYAKKIIWYRESLGGFQDLNQLREVKDFPDSVFQKIMPQLQLDNVLTLNKLNTNTSTTKELSRHPYIEWKQAEAIIKYRNQHGNYKGIDDIKKILSLKEDFITKIEPYLRY